MYVKFTYFRVHCGKTKEKQGLQFHWRSNIVLKICVVDLIHIVNSFRDKVNDEKQIDELLKRFNDSMIQCQENLRKNLFENE